jgi:hypothetical protein
MKTPSSCQPLEGKVAALKSQIAALSAMLVQGPEDPKPGKPDPEVLAEKQALVKELTATYQKFSACMISHGGKLPVNTMFTGTVTLTIQDSNPQIQGPFVHDVSMGLLFHEWDHSTFEVTSFTPIVVGPFSVPGGTDTIDITMPNLGGSGKLNLTTNAMSITLPALRFHHSHWAPHPSNISFKLSTSNPGGAALDAAGNVALAGTATFQGGYLGNDSATAIAKGIITPRP